MPPLPVQWSEALILDSDFFLKIILNLCQRGAPLLHNCSTLLAENDPLLAYLGGFFSLF